MTTTPAVQNAEIDEALAAVTTDLHLDTARALVRLPHTFGDRLLPGQPHCELVCDLVRDLVRAGFTVHDCDARDRTGGVCLRPSSGEPGGVIVTWTTHTAMALDQRRWTQHADVGLLLNFALDDVLCALGWRTKPFGSAGAHLVTGRLGDESAPEASDD